MDHGPGPYAEFEAFVAGAAGRLLRVAILLTAEPATPASDAPSPAPTFSDATATAAAEAPAARGLLGGALARTYANWRRLRGDDPYDHTRQELCAAFARTGRRHHGGSGVLGRLGPLERLVVVLRLYEGVAEEVTAAQLGLTPERVRALCDRAVAELGSRPGAAPGPRPDARRKEAA
ncbi:RNA polymerase [Streptomyces sp. NBC_00193]|uniref:sigma factor-like helix-turn-helix DNA-binding protein n=1 Tax=unclassified Streptomyces TaxID=2593676 RepID=UPI002252A570|nr:MULTISPECIES: sigma factor-like helix-turn-helix DNA-binding protein [unclassified Streptomyces]MCX5122900.1 RNA polymerase [Streptomyces sp. NBC_00347]MCX5296257.1 RNA polymerase [Streptomyces sp. NBC_00193]